jgi:hypothetical protein
VEVGDDAIKATIQFLAKDLQVDPSATNGVGNMRVGSLSYLGKGSDFLL